MEKHLKLADWCKALEPSVLREMIDVVSKSPGIISFATGLPEQDLFPVQEYKESIATALSSDPLTLQYRPPFEPLKNHIVEIMKRRYNQFLLRAIFFFFTILSDHCIAL